MTLDPAHVQLAIASQYGCFMLAHVELTTDTEPEEEKLGIASPKGSRTHESEMGTTVTLVSVPTTSGSASHVVGYKANGEPSWA